MRIILYKRRNKVTSARTPLLGILILSLVIGPNSLFAAELPTATDTPVKTVTIGNKKGAIDSGKNARTKNTSDFLAGGALSKSDPKAAASGRVAQVVDGNADKATLKDGKLIIEVKIDEASEKTKAFLNKAAGPLQSRPETKSVTFTLSSDGNTIEKAEFSSREANYTVSFAPDSAQVTKSVVTDLDDELDLENNYTVEYKDNLTDITFTQFQNDGSARIEVTKNRTETTLKHYWDPAEVMAFRTTTITSDSTGIKNIRSEVQFSEEEEPVLEYEANASGKNFDLSFESAYGLYSTIVSGADSIYDLIENRISPELTSVEVKQYFLQTLEQQLGESFFSVDDLKNNIMPVDAEPSYASLNFLGYPIVITFNTDPETFETKPLTITPDLNRNGRVDGREPTYINAILHAARKFFNTNEVIDLADFTSNAIPLDSSSVYYNGEILTLNGKGNFLKVSYKKGGSVFLKIKRLHGRKSTIIYSKSKPQYSSK